MALTEDAKAEIAAAIRIVREDKFEKYARTTIGSYKPKEEEKPKEDGLEKPEDKEKAPAPPEKEKEKEEPKEKRRSSYWGEIED